MPVLRPHCVWVISCKLDEKCELHWIVQENHANETVRKVLTAGIKLVMRRWVDFCLLHSCPCAWVSEVPSHPLMPLTCPPTCYPSTGGQAVCGILLSLLPLFSSLLPFSASSLQAFPSPVPSIARWKIPPILTCLVALFPGAVPPSFPVPLTPFWLAWERKQQCQE